MNLTTKQRQILRVINRGLLDEEGNQIWMTIDDVVENIPYQTTKSSMQFSIRALIKRGLVSRGQKELRNGRWRSPIIPSHRVVDFFKPKPNKPVIFEDEVADIVEYS